MAWLIGCRHGMARRLSPWRGSQVGGSEVVGIAWHGGCRRRLLAWHGGCRHGMAYAVAMAWLTGYWHRMARRLLVWHGGC